MCEGAIVAMAMANCDEKYVQRHMLFLPQTLHGTQKDLTALSL